MEFMDESAKKSRTFEGVIYGHEICRTQMASEMGKI